MSKSYWNVNGSVLCTVHTTRPHIYMLNAHNFMVLFIGGIGKLGHLVRFNKVHSEWHSANENSCFCCAMRSNSSHSNYWTFTIFSCIVHHNQYKTDEYTVYIRKNPILAGAYITQRNTAHTYTHIEQSFARTHARTQKIQFCLPPPSLLS